MDSHDGFVAAGLVGRRAHPGLQRLQRGAFTDPDSYFHRYASLSEPEAIDYARSIWSSINGPNLEQNILPTRARADLVLRKASHHGVASVLLRKV